MESEIESILNQSSNQETSLPSPAEENKVAFILMFTGWTVLVAGILGGLIIGFSLTDPDSTFSFSPEPHPLRWLYGGSLILSSFVSGIIFIGFGEIIKLLQAIKNKTTTV